MVGFCISFSTIPRKTVGTVGTNARNQGMMRVTGRSSMGTTWEQTGNRVGTEWEQFYIMRKHIHINPCFPCFPPFASRPAAPPQSAWLRCTRTHVAGNERVRAFPWSPLRRRQACMRVHGHLLAHDVANLLIENHYQKLPRSRLRESPKGKSRAERLRRCFVQRAGRRRIAVDNFCRCCAQKMSNCTPPANPHECWVSRKCAEVIHNAH